MLTIAITAFTFGGAYMLGVGVLRDGLQVKQWFSWTAGLALEGPCSLARLFDLVAAASQVEEDVSGNPFSMATVRHSLLYHSKTPLIPCSG